MVGVQSTTAICFCQITSHSEMVTSLTCGPSVNGKLLMPQRMYMQRAYMSIPQNILAVIMNLERLWKKRLIFGHIHTCRFTPLSTP